MNLTGGKISGHFQSFLLKFPRIQLGVSPLEPFFEINPGILCSGIGS